MLRPAAKAINKPLLIAGVDMRLAGLALVIATVVGGINDGLYAKAIAAVLFLGVCSLARSATKRDPNLLAVWNQARKQRWLYDPAKHRWFRVTFRRES